MAKQAKAALALFTASISKGKKASKKASRKEPAKKSSEKEKAPKKTEEGSASAKVPAPELWDEYQALYNKATFAKEATKNKRKTTATKMFQFYTNLLSLDAKYAWNKIVQEQTEADPFKDLQGISRIYAQGDFCVSHLMNALCSTFSLCFPTMQLSKKITSTFPTCLRSPRGMTYASSYST